MWLINVETGRVEEFIGSSLPPFAVLSHTWEEGQEVTFQEMGRPQAREKRGYRKIEMTCKLAAQDGLGYAWVDTCCIDKSSSAELTEAINSMFNWYRRSDQCYAYLADLVPVLTMRTLSESRIVGACRWFERGWTLQELIAPAEVKFYNRDWEFCFQKSDTSRSLAIITSIDYKILIQEKYLRDVAVAQKMSWASHRRTTRTEDTAYCLMGLFGINMPLLYGEGKKAFSRLQAEIINSCPDPSIFAWTYPEESGIEHLFTGVLAPSPESFASCTETQKPSSYFIPDFSTSNRGIKLRAKFGLRRLRGEKGQCLILPVCRLRGEELCIQMRNIGDSCFARQNPAALVPAKGQDVYVEPKLSRIAYEPFLLTRLTVSNSTKTWGSIMTSRFRCLQVDLEPLMDIYNRWPWSDWDEVDRVFFAPRDSHAGWAALKLVCHVPEFDGCLYNDSFDFLFYAFGWNSAPDSNRPPICGVHRVFGSLADRHLEDLNDRAVNEKWDAYWVANRLRMNETPEQMVIVGPSSRRFTMLLTFTIDIATDARICSSAFWRVQFQWKVVPSRDVSSLTAGNVDRHWQHIVPFE